MFFLFSSKNVFGLKVKKKKKKAGKALVFSNKGALGMASKANTDLLYTALFMGIHLNNLNLIFIDDPEMKSATEEPPDAESEIPHESYLSAYVSFREDINTKRCTILYSIVQFHMWFTKIIFIACTIFFFFFYKIQTCGQDFGKREQTSDFPGRNELTLSINFFLFIFITK